MHSLLKTNSLLKLNRLTKSFRRFYNKDVFDSIDKNLKTMVSFTENSVIKPDIIKEVNINIGKIADTYKLRTIWEIRLEVYSNIALTIFMGLLFYFVYIFYRDEIKHKY